MVAALRQALGVPAPEERALVAPQAQTQAQPAIQP
jgi:hypothetical protein